MIIIEKNKIFAIIKKLKRLVREFRDNGVSAEETRIYMNKHYIIKELKEFGIRFPSQEELEKILSYMGNERDVEISKIFYEIFNNKEFFPPTIEKIYVDTPYRSRKIGNVVETEFEDYSKVSGKDFDVVYSYDGECYELYQEFTVEGKLVSTCKKSKNKNKKGKKFCIFMRISAPLIKPEASNPEDGRIDMEKKEFQNSLSVRSIEPKGFFQSDREIGLKTDEFLKIDEKDNLMVNKQDIYTFDRIKELVEIAGLERTGKSGILLSPKNANEFEYFKRKYKKRPSQVPIRVKCGRCGYEWNTTISNIVQSKTKEYSWCTKCITPTRYSFDKIKHKVYDTIIKFIKDEIGVNHNQFAKYIRYIEVNQVDKEIIIEKLFSNQILNEIIKEVGVANHKKPKYHIKRCLQVISLALIKCKNYNLLLEELLMLIDLKRDTLVKTIKKYITYLGEIYNIDVNHWLPKEIHTPYTFLEIKSYIEKKGWVLLSPRNQNEFNNLKRNVSSSNIPLIVHCSNPEHLEWNTTFRSILNNNSNCPDCVNNVVTYNQINQMVKYLGIKISGKEGILIHPDSNEHFLQIRRERGTQPSYIPLIVSCRVQKHQAWKTNAVHLSQKRWCRECYLERNTKYDFHTIKAMVERKGGKLIYPTNEEEYDKLLNLLKSTKSKHNTPCDLPIIVSCKRNHRPFTTTPNVIAQNHWCPLCGEKYSVVGTLIHPIVEFLFLQLFLLKECNAKCEKKLFSDKQRLVDILVKRNKQFIDNIERRQNILKIPEFHNFIIIDFTISRDLQNIIEHCERGYQSNDRLLIIVLLRFREQQDGAEIRKIKDAINNNFNIDHNQKKNIKLFTSDQFLAFLNLNIDITKWNNNKNEINILKEEIKIIQEYKKILNTIEVILNSESDYDELINKLSELSDIYKKKLLKL